MIRCGVPNLRAVVGKKRPITGARVHTGASGVVSSEAANARTSGCSSRRNSSGGATATTFPLSSSTMREASSSASRRSWVTKTIVFCNLCASARNSRCNSARVTGSRAPNGSSINKIGGSAASARATPTRCLCPPESSRGRRSANSAGSSPTSLSSSPTRAAVRRPPHFSSDGTNPTFSATVKCGKSPAS